jgi:hypothetical protein
MAAIADVVLAGRSCRVIDLPSIGGPSFARLPWLHRVFLENLLRRTPADDPARSAAGQRKACCVSMQLNKILLRTS